LWGCFVARQNVVVVESPAKAKTIEKYLGDDFRVLASFGHIRDLPPKDGSVRPDEDFAMDWEMGERADRPLKEIINALKGAKTLYLATDPDREGEAISWHVEEVLREKKLLNGIHVQRITFNEITKNAVNQSLNQPRQVDQALVDAYLARRALDYLVGFTLSPVLWRKLPGSRSAGRVQSVALRLICERESEIEVFKPQEYWSIEIVFQTPRGDTFTARVNEIAGKKIDRLGIKNQTDAEAIVADLQKSIFSITAIERKQVKRHPYPPFITSTLQQEASRKLGFSATQTMRLAQQLYEGVDLGGETVGLITYMRTDGVALSQDAINASRKLIAQDFGDKYVPEKPRIYKSKAKNAQEAHEAIRPTDLFRRPESMRQYLENDQWRLYDLIWKRTIACEMESALLDQVAVDIHTSDHQIGLRANGSIIAFDGFLAVYQESRDDDEEDENNRRLPPMTEGEKPERQDIKSNQHFTQPPPRYSEASLVKKMEELGIGRPSTYASILQVLQDRSYVRLDKKRFIPEDRGRMVTAFLQEFFSRYVEYDFTAGLETQLDEVSGGQMDWKQVLRNFWTQFSGAIDHTKDLKISDVIDTLDAALGQHFFPTREDGTDPRQCPACQPGRLSLKLGKTGGFIGCSNYPDCRYTSTLEIQNSRAQGEDVTGDTGPKILGDDPVTGLKVTLRRGPYGAYVQLGPAEGTEDKKKKDDKPKRASLPKRMAVEDITFDSALKLLDLPRDIGPHPESGVMILAGIGRFGPYLKIGPRYQSIPDDDTVLNIGINHAVEILASTPDKRAGGTTTAGREIGPHPEDGTLITLHDGRYGPYVKHGKLMASLSKSDDGASLTPARAAELLAAKAAKDAASGKAPKGKKAPAKKAAEKKPAKPKAVKKAPTAKKTAKKADKKAKS